LVNFGPQTAEMRVPDCKCFEGL